VRVNTTFIHSSEQVQPNFHFPNNDYSEHTLSLQKKKNFPEHHIDVYQDVTNYWKDHGMLT
jgi:hypothetical protein